MDGVPGSSVDPEVFSTPAFCTLLGQNANISHYWRSLGYSLSSQSSKSLCPARPRGVALLMPSIVYGWKTQGTSLQISETPLLHKFTPLYFPALKISATSAAPNYSFCFLYSMSLWLFVWAPLSFATPSKVPPGKRPGWIWNSLLCFPTPQDHIPILYIDQCLKTAASNISSDFRVVYSKRVSLIPFIMWQPEVVYPLKKTVSIIRANLFYSK